VQKEKRNPDAEKEEALQDLENRDDLEVTNPPLGPQHLLDRRGAAHSNMSRRSARDLNPVASPGSSKTCA
jgi:hypothetical protein